jgi:hypothetical protein
MRTTVLALLSLASLTGAVAILPGCGGAATPRIVTLLPSAPIVPNTSAPLEVVSRSTAVADPLPVRNSSVVYGDIEAALGTAVSTATAPWADEHKDTTIGRAGGWTVLVELTGAEATLEPGGRVVVGLDVRATLRTRHGNAYLGQTQLNCRDGGLRSADEGAPIIYRCMTHIGRDLAGWLAGGVRLDPPPAGPT